MGRPRGRGRRAPGTEKTQRRLPAALLVVAIVAAAAAGAAHPAWAQAHDETRHGRLAVEEPVYVMEAHMPVTVRITGQVFAESDERRQVVVAVTLPDSSRSEQYATATRSGHFAVPYQLDKPFPTGADSRPGRYAVSASHGGAHLGTVHFEVVRPPQVPAALPGSGEGVGDPAAESVGVTGLSASVGRPVYSPDAAVTVHGAAEGAGAGVRLRIDVAGPSGGVVYSGALTTSTAGTYSATVMAPNGRWGGDGEYTAVVTGAGQLARAPFWVESGDMGGGGVAAVGAAAAREEAAVQAAGAAAAREEAADPAEPRRPDVPVNPGQSSEYIPPQGAAPREAAGRSEGAEEGLDMALVLAAVTVVVVAGFVAAIAVRRVQGSGRGERTVAGSTPEARGPAAARPAPRPEARGPAAARPAAPSGPPLGAGQGKAAPRRRASGGMRLVLDMSVVINHKRRSEDKLENLDFYGPQLDYVDSRKGSLLLPKRDTMRPDTEIYARSMLVPFKNVYGYERYEAALEKLKGRLVDDPLSDESIRWVARKFKWASASSGGAKGRIAAVLDGIEMPEGMEGRPGGRIAREAIAEYGGTEDGRKDMESLLRRLVSESSQDLQILAIAMKESENRPSILLTTDYDLFAFPI